MRTFLLVIINILYLNFSSGQINLETLDSYENKLIKQIQKMKYFPVNRVFDKHFVIYYANVNPKDWSIESAKDRQILSKLIFEKQSLKRNNCKDAYRLSSDVHFVNSKVKNDYFFTDGYLFYSKFADLDTVLVNLLVNENEKGLIINILNLKSDIYFIVKNNEIKNIFDRRLGKMFDLESYISDYSENLKLDKTFDFINN